MKIKPVPGFLKAKRIIEELHKSEARCDGKLAFSIVKNPNVHDVAIFGGCKKCGTVIRVIVHRETGEIINIDIEPV